MRFYHGAVDPNELTMPQYWGYLDRCADLIELEAGHTDHRARVERLARRRHEEEED